MCVCVLRGGGGGSGGAQICMERGADTVLLPCLHRLCVDCTLLVLALILYPLCL